MTNVKVAVVGDDVNMIESIKAYFSARNEVSIVWEGEDAERAMKEFEELGVDVVITQVLVSGISGLDLVEYFANKEYCPKFIVVSELKNETFMCRCFESGASAYLLKPINFKVLESKILGTYSKSEATDFRANRATPRGGNDRTIDERLATIFVSIGIPPHIKGYQFLRDGIKYVVEDPSVINSITGKLYPFIAQKNDTTPSKVERAIRHAIGVAWNRGKIDSINNLFGVKVYSQNEKPTNGEFIALLADKMLLEGS